ncbi:MAG: response regulator [Gammaproteobacteria bacterium]|nr:MAG: response regulator [Gammaproteobacteria bacterium]
MDSVILAHEGLRGRDMILIRNLSRMDETWYGMFALAHPQRAHEGQVLLIDIDSPERWRQAERALNDHLYEAVITISDHDQAPPGAIHLTRPLLFRKLAHALEDATAFRQAEAEEAHVLNVLVVDDSLPVRTFMKQKLHELFHLRVGVDVAESGEDALLLCSQHHYPLVFMDVMMEGMDGYQACRQIKKLSGSHVIMLTSKTSAYNRVKARIAGCDGYITKPPEDQALREAVTRFLASTPASVPAAFPNTRLA